VSRWRRNLCYANHLLFINTSSSTFENAFLHYRDLYLAAGVAPALPGLMLVAIAYLGILAYLRRIHAGSMERQNSGVATR